MADNSNSASGNSWTLLTPQESRVENVGPVAEGEPSSSTVPEPLTKCHSDLVQHSSDAAELQPQTEPSTQEQSDLAHTHASEHAKGTQPPESPQVAPPETSDDRAQLNVNEDSTSVSGTVEDLSSWTPDHKEQSALTGYSKSPVSPSGDGDLFSDSYTHISPNSGSNTLPASVCQGGEEFKIEEESYLRKTITEEYKPDVEVLETKGTEGGGLRKRPISQMGPLDQGKTEEEDDEEGDEEEFQPPQKVEETVFSLNKCILAAVILLGLGTIFFSEGDIDVRELKDPTNQEWLNPEVSRDTPIGFEPPDILSKQAKEDQRILVLQAQLQQHLSELKAAQLLAEEGEKERVKREELEKEYQRIKGELDRLPAIQKELEQENVRMKEEIERAKRDLDALPSLHRELEHLKETLSQLTQSTGQAEPVHPIAASEMPSTGDIRDVPPIERQEMKIKKHWDKKSREKEQIRGEKEEKKRKGGKKEDKHMKNPKDWKKDKSNQEQGKAWKSKDERKEWQDEKELKKDKKQEDSKTVKENGKKKALKEWEEKKNWKEDKKRIKDKHGGQNERRVEKKEWKEAGYKKVKEVKEWKQRGERKNEKEEKEWKPRGEQKDWKEDKEWKNDKESGRNDQKERKEWKEKDEWKGEKEWGKGKGEGKVNEKTKKKWKLDGEFPKMYAGKETQKKHSEKRGKEKEWSKDGAWKREGIKEEKKSKACYHKNEGKNCHNEKEEPHKDEKELSNTERHRHGPTDETSNHYHNDREIYWGEQRRRIQHYHGQRETCSGVADCARAEGLAPVSLRDFEMLLQNYLAKLPDPEDQMSKKEELSKFVKEFFTDGVFAHDQMPFSEFVEDVGDILEDMAEGEESELEDSEEDNDEMEEFERDAMEKFALPKVVGKVEKKGERKKESGRVKN
ncbi:pre-B-cell leukemia transcription factor-interacting protein 1-like isoform X2 [Myxocyprinus asiaticus]|uniref:pre-B-cell leukemia transcription factor-interacting protein 1-like isoform X2 n=1 Tax=Myxocyprinus asiaticus TaxID=70543 RepID=UPI0022233289|nr:pre-B-cell leukemia transcription factor-interacting protein 1-like isoform X2 [Myxocyprinus asiaticus]